MNDLSKYYGKDLIYVVTELKNGQINNYTQVKKVYNPLDFRLMVRPCSGCDIVIGDNSTSSHYIFDIGGIQETNNIFSFDRYSAITLFNYCEYEQVEQVKIQHRQAIKKALVKYIQDQQNRMLQAIEIAASL